LVDGEHSDVASCPKADDGDRFGRLDDATPRGLSRSPRLVLTYPERICRPRALVARWVAAGAPRSGTI
jgi:hypothetical protein